MKFIFVILLFISTLSVFAQGPYAPSATVVGTTAIHKDSSIIIDWAVSCEIERGKQNIASINSDTTTVGSTTSALAKADGLDVVSLGDGGSAVLRFQGNIYNGVGPDFVVFENAFNTSFLELAFVEVSSDGVNFFRFPAHSLSDTLTPVGSFGAVDPTQINNLAGKYQANYGTPFDLEELKNLTGLDVQNISHIRIIDVVGTLNDQFATRDTANRKINDQYPTEFPSGGFDLDAVGVIYLKTVGLKEKHLQSVSLFPNPAKQSVNIRNKEFVNTQYQITDLKGREIQSGTYTGEAIKLKTIPSGIYLFRINNHQKSGLTKLVIR